MRPLTSISMPILTLIWMASFFVTKGVTMGQGVDVKTPETRITMPGSPFGVAWGFLYGYEGVESAVYVPELRRMNAGFTKIYLIWNQVEPEKGHYDWKAVDTFVDQLKSPEEGLIAVFSTSTWATRLSARMLPPSPAKDPEDYYRFINALVKRYRGRVRYWQNDCEPNNPIYWSGTAPEFVAQLKVFNRAVKDADPKAVVVVGGYDGVFNPPGMWQMPGQERGLAFFDYVFKEGANDFDLFDLRLYTDPYTIPACVSFMRQKMKDLGYQKPIICTEYHGPGFFGFQQNLQFVRLVQQWSDSITKQEAGGQSTGGQNPIAALYAKMNTLAPQTQMFMADCSKELEDKFGRMQSRDLVMRNVLALSAGVQKTLFWDFWHDTSQRDDLMHLMYSKFRMMDYQGGAFKRRFQIADAFQRMAEVLDNVEQVRRIDLAGRPSIFLFEAQRRGKSPVYIVWERREAFSGEDKPSTMFEWPWPAQGAKAVDALGQNVNVKLEAGRLSLAVSITPIFIEPVK